MKQIMDKKSNKRKYVVIIAVVIFSLGMAFLITSYAKRFSGTEVKNQYMEDFFRPEAEHESVKVIERKDGKRYVVVDFGRKLNDDELNQYQITLATRGFNEYYMFEHPASVIYEVIKAIFGIENYSVYEMQIFRPTSEEGALEFSVNDINPPGAELRRAVNFAGLFTTKVAVEIAPDFGKKWERWEFKPKEEMPGPDPRIGKYPSSIRADVISSYGGVREIIYYSKESEEKILEYYQAKFRRLKSARQELKISEGVREHGNTYMYGKYIHPTKTNWLILDGVNIYISIQLQQSYFSNELKKLKISERITGNKNQAFIEQGDGG